MSIFEPDTEQLRERVLDAVIRRSPKLRARAARLARLDKHMRQRRFVETFMHDVHEYHPDCPPLGTGGIQEWHEAPGHLSKMSSRRWFEEHGW